MTQLQLADLSTISIRAIRDLELERTKTPRAETIRLLAEALRLSEPRRAELERAAARQVVNESLIDEVTAPPAPLGAIVGREHEVAALIDMLESGGHRLITVAGMPGTGKTRLIQEVAGRLHRSRSMPVICVGPGAASTDDGALIHSPDALLDRMAGPLGCRATLDDVVRTVANSRILITVDGRELDQDADLALRLLLSRCPGVRVLYERCDRSSPFGDAVFSVFPLAVPEWGYGEDPVTDLTAYPSVQLLRAHGAQLHPGSASDRAVLNAVAGICWCLDGNPAMLETAASWLLLYSASELLETAARSPLAVIAPTSDIGDSLTTWLERTVASLSQRDAEFLRRLVEVEPWTVGQAVDFLGGSVEALRGIHTLRARGLVRRTDPLNSARPRFTVLNLMRHFLRSAAEAVPARATRGVSPSRHCP
jgi:transcriptional regulator with XRE-family HTH domain